MASTMLALGAAAARPLGCRRQLGRSSVAGRSAASAPRLRVRSEASTEQAQAPEKLSARQSGLALMLDDGTRKAHSMAENTQFVTGFFKGIAERDAFAQLVTGLYFVYEAMESAFDEASHPGVKALDYSELRRLDSLKEDMEYFYGPGWRDTVRPSEATAKYVARVREVAAGAEPSLLIAHQYTRYLGDLFGGQMMGGMATRSLGLEEGRGVSFYTFGGIPDAKAFIEEWYGRLNALDLSQQEKEAVVDEANLVFALNIELFGELEGSAAGSTFAVAARLAWGALLERLGLGKEV